MTSKETTQNLVTCSSDDTDNSSSIQIDLPDAIDEDDERKKDGNLSQKDRNGSFVESERRFAERRFAGQKSRRQKKTNSVASSGAVRHAKCLNRMETLAKMETAFAVAAAVNNSGTKREERPPSTNSNRDIAAYSGPSTKTSARNKRLKRNLNSFVGSLKEMYEDEVERVKEEHENEKAALKAELQSKTEEIEALKDEVREQATKITELEATAFSVAMILASS